MAFTVHLASRSGSFQAVADRDTVVAQTVAPSESRSLTASENAKGFGILFS